MNEEEAYNTAMNELKSGRVSDGIWAKSIAHSNGEESNAKANYLRFRAEQLLSDERSHKKIAFRLGLISILFSSNGKIPRWLFLVIFICNVFIFTFLNLLIEEMNANSLARLLISPIYVASAWSILCAHIKRSRDLGVSPWVILVYLSPWLAPIALLCFLCIPSRVNNTH